jgi:hypothetical protein
MTESLLSYYERMSAGDRFLFQTQGLWTTIFWVFAAFRIFLHMWIYKKAQSPFYHPNVTGTDALKQRYLGQSTADIEKLRKKHPDIKDPTVDGNHMGRDQEFLLICFFTFWWNKEPDDSKTLLKWKHRANIANFIFLALLLFVILLFFYLQEYNLRLDSFKKDWFYLLSN